MNNKWLAEAVSNNAAWCDAIASSHNISTSWNELLWISEQPMPRFYPNTITLKSGVLIDKEIDSIKPKLPLGWGIKDSFSELDLTSKGFSPAFDAQWFCRVPTHDLINRINLQHQVKKVSTQIELKRWATAWGDCTHIFNSALLENNSIELLYVEHHDKIAAGLTTNLSGNSVGISNTFGSANEWLSCVISVIETNPDKGIVGYGDKEEITALSRIGFQENGDLRVWLCQ